MDDMLKDARFAHIAKDPKFRRIPKHERKVKIDKRFQSMFKDKKFTVKYTVDKRGRPVNQTSTENLRKYYELSSGDDDDDDESSYQNSKSSETMKRSKNKMPKDKNKKSSVSTKNLETSMRNKNKIKLKRNKSSSSYISDDSKVGKSEENENDCFSSNGNLLRIKSKAKSVSDSENNEESSDIDSDGTSNFSKVDLEENENQLHIKKSNEIVKIENGVKKKLRDLTVDYARGEGILLTDSSSDDESSEYEEEEDEIEHDWGELDKEAETTDEITHRLAACNMDWDRIRAVDLMVLFNSFLSSSGLIHSVTIYPSEFGLRRMKEEEIKGPIELVDTKIRNSDDDAEDVNEEGSEYHMEKLRQYQLNRLKYYYAVIVCDSPETANKIYVECDGIEYESTATKLDLRFIPDDMTFDHEPKEVCNKIPELSKYQPRQFTTSALQQVKVELTWDETNPERQEITQKLNSGKIDEVDENDIQAYLASDMSDDEADDKIKIGLSDNNLDSEENENPIEKYKSLLRSVEELEEAKKKQDIELEFTWGLGSKEKTEKLVQERLKKDENLTPFEQYLEKRKVKRKAKREERKKLRDKSENGLAESDSEDSIPSDVDMNDPYFKEELKSMKSKTKKRKNEEVESSHEEEKEEQSKAELELLLMDGVEDDSKKHFNMKQIEEIESASKSKKKRMSKKKKDEKAEGNDDDFEVNVKDPRFSALFSSHHFNIDPADSHYRKTKGTDAIINEKFKRRTKEGALQDTQTKQTKSGKKINAELTALIKSVKRNTENISKAIK